MVLRTISVVWTGWVVDAKDRLVAFGDGGVAATASPYYSQPVSFCFTENTTAPP
jgi:hypothetical protein